MGPADRPHPGLVIRLAPEREKQQAALYLGLDLRLGHPLGVTGAAEVAEGVRPERLQLRLRDYAIIHDGLIPPPPVDGTVPDNIGRRKSQGLLLLV